MCAFTPSDRVSVASLQKSVDDQRLRSELTITTARQRVVVLRQPGLSRLASGSRFLPDPLAPALDRRSLESRSSTGRGRRDRAHVGPIECSSEEPNAFVERIYAENAQRLRGWLTSICRDETAAEDLMQEAFVRLLRETRDGRTPDDPVAWLHRVGANLAMTRGRRISVADRRAGKLAPPALVGSPEATVVSAEGAAAVHEALTGLDDDDREAVVLAAHGYRGPEIAARSSFFRSFASLIAVFASAGVSTFMSISSSPRASRRSNTHTHTHNWARN
jgi:RNA polymerase sigma factor (sigma-70 family)